MAIVLSRPAYKNRSVMAISAGISLGVRQLCSLRRFSLQSLPAGPRSRNVHFHLLVFTLKTGLMPKLLKQITWI